MKKMFGVPDKYSKLRIYRIFVGMHNRCEHIANTHYENYGGRGISVCKEWSGKDGFFYFTNGLWRMDIQTNCLLTELIMKRDIALKIADGSQ